MKDYENSVEFKNNSGLPYWMNSPSLADLLDTVLAQNSLLEAEPLNLKALIAVNYALPEGQPTDKIGSVLAYREVLEIICQFPREYEKLKWVGQFYQECARTHKAKDAAERVKEGKLNGQNPGHLVTLLALSAMYAGMEAMFVKALSLVDENLGITKGRWEKAYCARILKVYGKKHAEYSEAYSEIQKETFKAINRAKTKGKDIPANLEGALEQLLIVGNSFLCVKEPERSSSPIPTLSPRLSPYR